MTDHQEANNCDRRRSGLQRAKYNPDARQSSQAILDPDNLIILPYLAER
jgi:hypothetical protein